MDYRTNGSMFSLLTEHWEEHDVLSVVVEIARKINGADRGNLQLFDRGLGGLRIAAQHGFEQPFLDFFELVADDGSACGEAMARNQVIVVPDVQHSPIFDVTAKRIMLDAGALSVQSTPLINSSGQLIGVLSTHFDQPWEPTHGEQYLVHTLADVVADWFTLRR